MKKHLLCVVLMSAFSFQSAANELPFDCSYKDKSNTGVDFAKLPNLIEASWNLYQTPSPWASKTDFLSAIYSFINSESDLKISGPGYILRNSGARIKADLDFLDPNDKLRDVSFYNSEQGYLGKDRSNWDSNAYYSMDFKYTHGPAVVWARTGERCQAMSVVVQKDKPQIKYHSKPYSNSPNRVTVTVGWMADKYSKLGIKGTSANARLWVRAVGAQGIGAGASKAISKTQGNTTLNIYSSQSGVHTVEAWVSDGSYTSERLYLGRVDVGGTALERPCPTCPPY